MPDLGVGIVTSPPTAKKGRTNTPWSPAEEQRLKAMRDAGSSWSDIAKVSALGLGRRRRERSPDVCGLTAADADVP